MKFYVLIIALIAAAVAAYSFSRVKSANRLALQAVTPKSFYDLSYQAIDGSTVSMSSYKGKYVLCVNVASKCGYTRQYEDLQKLYEQYKDKLVIIGFPCNQFGAQEPGDEATVENFCKKNYGVTFPLSSKIDVKGSNQHPVYTWLTSKNVNGVSDASIGWNFNKILVGKNGNWLQHYGSNVSPMSPEITAKLQ